ncbi:MAG: YSIRK-type signal peptide-containing protein, partial [Streptococcus parasanguinis]|nr:YSIRK-type signal peptide-containing protein [Streptococcus parasanguinis]
MGKDLFNDRISRFSIRKLNVGVCSVLLGTLVMVGTAASAAAEEKTDTISESVAAVATASEAPATSTATSAASTAETTSTYDANAAITAPATSTAAASTSAASSTSTATSAASTAPETSTAATPKLEATTPGNMAVEAASTTTDKKEEVASGIAPSTTETPAVTAETSGARSRTRRALGDANDPNLIGYDVEDATSTPKVEKPGFTTDVKAADLASQISWLDFGDKANWTGTTTTSDGKLALQVGATYTKEIMPGYVVTIKVKSLKPFQATELYKKRLEDRGATEAEKATYDPNAKNGYIGTTTTPATNKAFKDGEEAKVIADAQNRWTEIRREGIDTGTTKQTTISSEFDGGNIGVQFEISATFRGKVVKPAIVMADGESANPGELVLFTTNGEGWKHIGEWKKASDSQPYVVQDTEDLFETGNYKRGGWVDVNGKRITSTNLGILKDAKQVGPDKKAVAWKYFGSADLTTGGLGTGVFGPNISGGNVSVPLVMTRGASEVGLYIASSGKQAAMLGFFPLDEGDAPESYGKAVHSIATVDGITGKKVNQPYLGHLSPDMDENNTLDWTGDDKATTADEGIDQLLPGDLKGKTNELIKMDRTKPGNYKISVEAHTGGAAQANIYGWVDFNQNGTFDEDERSDLTTITQDGTATLRFTKSKTYIDPSVNELGVRVRIAKDADQIESPTGMAFSGEVEDFKTQITHPPKGEFKETTGLQGAKQTATVAFTARGLQGYSLTEPAKIDETVAPQMIDNRTGQVVTPGADGYYAVAGQGKYKITPN